MNTYELTEKNIHEFLNLSPWAQRSIIEDLRLARHNKELISIQLQEFNGDTELYGAYFKTIDEVSDYNYSGGLWLYTYPYDIVMAIKELTSISKSLVKLLDTKL